MVHKGLLNLVPNPSDLSNYYLQRPLLCVPYLLVLLNATGAQGPSHSVWISLWLNLSLPSRFYSRVTFSMWLTLLPYSKFQPPPPCLHLVPLFLFFFFLWNFLPPRILYILYILFVYVCICYIYITLVYNIYKYKLQIRNVFFLPVYSKWLVWSLENIYWIDDWLTDRMNELYSLHCVKFSFLYH